MIKNNIEIDVKKKCIEEVYRRRCYTGAAGRNGRN